MRLSSVVFGIGLFLCASASSFAAAVFERVVGDVRASSGQGQAVAMTQGQRIESGATVTTGADGQTMLRFDDGQAVVLNPDSEFKVTDYKFDRDRPQADNVVFELLKGAMRSVSGLIGARSRNSFALRVPQATIGIRGTDFMVALVNPAYMSVLNGAIAATNAAGTVSFAAGSLGTIATSGTLATSITAAGLPASVSASFSQMGSLAVSAAGAGAGAGTGAGAGAATGAAAGGVSLGVVGAVGAALGAAAALSSSSASSSSSATTTTTTTTTTR